MTNYGSINLIANDIQVPLTNEDGSFVNPLVLVTVREKLEQQENGIESHVFRFDGYGPSSGITCIAASKEVNWTGSYLLVNVSGSYTIEADVIISKIDLMSGTYEGGCGIEIWKNGSVDYDHGIEGGELLARTPLKVRGFKDVATIHMSVVSDLVAGDYVRLVLNNGMGKNTSIRWSFDSAVPLTAELRVYD